MPLVSSIPPDPDLAQSLPINEDWLTPSPDLTSAAAGTSLSPSRLHPGHAGLTTPLQGSCFLTRTLKLSWAHSAQANSCPLWRLPILAHYRKSPDAFEERAGRLFRHLDSRFL